jgi:hypothetical protein
LQYLLLTDIAKEGDVCVCEEKECVHSVSRHIRRIDSEEKRGNNGKRNVPMSRLLAEANIQFNKEEESLLQLGLNYALEKPTQQIIQELVIDTENAIRQLNENEHNIYRFLAHNKIKQIQNTTSTNTLHKRQNYVMRKIRNKLQQNNLIITKADKGKTIVIINKNTFIQKTEEFLKDNQFTQLQKDPTEKFQKQLQQIIPK